MPAIPVALRSSKRHGPISEQDTGASFSEIMAIGESRDPTRLEALSFLDLNVLFSYLNRQRVPLCEESAFTSFYLAVVERIRQDRK